MDLSSFCSIFVESASYLENQRTIKVYIMKNFLKMTLASFTGLIIYTIITIVVCLGIVGAVAAFGDKQPVMPDQAVLRIDMSSFVLGEQDTEGDPLTMLTSGSSVSQLGIYNAVKALNAAATDPAVKFIYLTADEASGGIAQMEEFRQALVNFRTSGKAIVAYTENPTNAGYYLSSVSDKIYMTPHDGGMSMFNGLSSQLIFLKDILDRLGVNVQLIRHGKYKSAGEMYIRSSSSKENLEQTSSMVNSMWDSWAAAIAESRNITVEELDAMLNNLELNFPSDWLEHGLVDELLTREELQQQLCDLYVTDNYKNVKMISLSDYAKIKNTVNYKAKEKIAVIYAEGNIVDGSDKQQVAGDRFANIIADVRRDSSIKAVVLRVNSPGGSVLASEKIKAELDLLQERVPVIASYGDYAASGGYWISANCDKIYSDATTLTGSIGVFSMIPDIGGTVKNKLHVNITSVNSNEHADMLGMFRALTPKELDYMQASVEKIYGKFTEIVSEGRDMPVARVDELAQGRVWTGAEALEIGLVDEIGTLEDAIRYAALTIDGVNSIEQVQIAEYPKPQTTMEMILESLGQTPSVLKGTALEDVEEAFKNASSVETGKAYARLPYEIVVR